MLLPEAKPASLDSYRAALDAFTKAHAEFIVKRAFVARGIHPTQIYTFTKDGKLADDIKPVFDAAQVVLKTPNNGPEFFKSNPTLKFSDMVVRYTAEYIVTVLTSAAPATTDKTLYTLSADGNIKLAALTKIAEQASVSTAFPAVLTAKDAFVKATVAYFFLGGGIRATPQVVMPMYNAAKAYVAAPSGGRRLKKSRRSKMTKKARKTRRV
jgi:hypothetical protein